MKNILNYQKINEVEHLSLQVVSDGPDSEEEILKSGFVRMIFLQKRVSGFKHRI